MSSARAILAEEPKGEAERSKIAADVDAKLKSVTDDIREKKKGMIPNSTLSFLSPTAFFLLFYVFRN